MSWAMSSPRDDTLVENQFWEQYYRRKLAPPIRPDRQLAFDQSMMRALTELINSNWSVAGTMLVA